MENFCWRLRYGVGAGSSAGLACPKGAELFLELSLCTNTHKTKADTNKPHSTTALIAQGSCVTTPRSLFPGCAGKVRPASHSRSLLLTLLIRKAGAQICSLRREYCLNLMNQLLFERSTGNVPAGVFVRLHTTKLLRSFRSAPGFRFDGGERLAVTPVAGSSRETGDGDAAFSICAHQAGVNALALERFDGRM